MSDEKLYTGITSQSFVKSKEEKQEKKHEASEKRKILLPAGELLKAEFAKEIDKVSRINYTDLDKLTNDYEVKAELIAQQRIVIMLTVIENRLTNLLRDNK
ncbi:MAG: hypothetical protein M0R80_17475 [Proteobacteria bacterium]|jgi:hypothetical protein|nr:hypothetical protein [Pseudomonadota bacterium]